MHIVNLINRRRLFQIVLAGALLFVSAVINAQTQTHIFIQNNSSENLIVKDVVISGDKLNKKAWKKGESAIAQGKREKVLAINRSGKFNWMDPTPRFIEPGKTVVFATTVIIESAPDSTEFQLRQKLLGTGKSSKMWHSSASNQTAQDWANDEQDYSAVWAAAEGNKLSVNYRTYKEKSNVHIEYVFSDSTE